MRRAVMMLALVGFAACASAGSVQADRRTWKVGNVQEGKATWYGKKFHGKQTASGERYDMNSMTAAHRSLPFGSVVRVTNLRNGKSAVVRINNRGPYGKGRIVDVSRAAARKLEMIDRGVVRAKLEVLKVGKKKKKKKKRKRRKRRAKK